MSPNSEYTALLEERAALWSPAPIRYDGIDEKGDPILVATVPAAVHRVAKINSRLAALRFRNPSLRTLSI